MTLRRKVRSLMQVRVGAGVLSLAGIVAVGGCASPAAPAGSVEREGGTANAARARNTGSNQARFDRSAPMGQVLARNEHLLIYRPVEADTLEGVAERFLGSRALAWTIAQANPPARTQADGTTRLAAGVPLVVPMKPVNPMGVHPARLQTVPILCYHRLGPGQSKMVVSAAKFEAQMTWLSENGYQVVRLADMLDFLAGKRGLPDRAVVLTFDDGYESVYRLAFPVLKKLGMPASVFVYTDFLGGGDALTWSQLREMQASGLIDVQSHSKSHRNLIERRADESDERYRAAVDAEMRQPKELLERRLPPLQVRHLAYPFGDANALVADSAARHGFDLAVTVVPGGNAFYAQPLMLRRSMIFGDMSLDTFKSRLQVEQALSLP
jgi:peptidoglycan/xylan/chitin deacetylase (PgdA/CDA1 family)